MIKKTPHLLELRPQEDIFWYYSIEEIKSKKQNKAIYYPFDLINGR